MMQGNGLSDAYRATLTRLKAQKGNKSKLGLKVLMWVLHSERPLSAKELCHALGVELGSTDLDHENVPALRTLLASSLGLVTVEESSSTVRLVHFTLQEHLLSDSTLFHRSHSTIAEVCLTYLNSKPVRDLSPTLSHRSQSIISEAHLALSNSGSVPDLSPTLSYRFQSIISEARLTLSNSGSIRDPLPTLFYKSDSTISRVCLSYLNFSSVQELRPTLSPVSATTPLLEYASLYWAEHARKEMTENVKILALRLFDKFDENISARLILLYYYYATEDLLIHFDFGKVPIGFTGPHGAAFLGIVEIFAAVLKMKEWDLNARDFLSFTPLMWAAIRGHEGVVKALLERGDINLNVEDRVFHLTPLSWATLKGHEGVVKVFLEQEGINPNGAGAQDSHTPLFLATISGHVGIIKMLLEREDINPNQASGRDAELPLSEAVKRGHEGVVKVLLEREDVNPNLVDPQTGFTPLQYAAGNGQDGIVKMLLERSDTRTDIRDNKNQTPLSLALSLGHDEIARMISECVGTKPNAGDPSGQASLPLSPADPDTPEVVSDCQGSIPNPAGTTIPSTEPPSPPRPPLLWPLKFWHSLRNIANAPPTLPMAINRHLIIASFVCILAFLLYILPFPSPDVFSFYR